MNTLKNLSIALISMAKEIYFLTICNLKISLGGLILVTSSGPAYHAVSVMLFTKYGRGGEH